MPSKLLIAVIVADALVLGSGILELVFAIIVKNRMNSAPSDGRDATRELVYQRLPLTAGMVNAGFILATFVMTIPGLLMPSARGWLKVSGYLVTFCAVFTLILGLDLWIMTLKIGENFTSVYMELESDVQGMIQSSFQCCGYDNSSSPPFITNPTCPSPAAAAIVRGCKSSVSNFANSQLDTIFTVVFGVVGIDVLFILAITCLSKERKDRQWYHRIDDKRGRW